MIYIIFSSLLCRVLCHSEDITFSVVSSWGRDRVREIWRGEWGGGGGDMEGREGGKGGEGGQRDREGEDKVGGKTGRVRTRWVEGWGGTGQGGWGRGRFVLGRVWTGEDRDREGGDRVGTGDRPGEDKIDGGTGRERARWAREGRLGTRRTGLVGTETGRVETGSTERQAGRRQGDRGDCERRDGEV
jgi:hypothetical protein